MHPQLTTHITLLERLGRENDQQAWREFHERYGELIRSFAERRGLQAADAEDVVQEVMIGLQRSLPGFRYDPARGRFRNYLKTIAERAIYRRFRQKQRGGRQQDIEAAGDAPASEPALEEIWEEQWRQYHLRQGMRVIAVEFNPRDRAAFEAYVIEGHDAGSTAERLGLSVDQVYQAKSRILRRLSEAIRANVQDEG